MKRSAIWASITLTTSAAGDISHLPGLSNLNLSHPDLRFKGFPRDGPNLEAAGDPSPGPSNPPDPIPDPNTVWGKAVCRGNKLRLGMTLSREKAAKHVTPLDSQWVGDGMEEKLIAWGYKDNQEHPSLDKECEFEHESNVFGLKEAFTHFGISTKSWANGGPNKCYRIVHRDGSAVIRGKDDTLPRVTEQFYKVAGRQYRVTDAHFTIGVNAKDGVIFFLDRESPASAAAKLWSLSQPPPANQLQAIRSSSDIAWALWVRHMGEQKSSITDIKKFMSLTIVNEETEDIMQQAISEWDPPAGQSKISDFQSWPGTTFDTTTIQGAALLGSNNGLAAAYFLVQHRLQLGDKWIPKITIFTDDKDETGTANMLFWVVDVPQDKTKPPPESEKRDTARLAPRLPVSVMKSRIVERGMDGYSIVREHTFSFRAKL